MPNNFKEFCSLELEGDCEHSEFYKPKVNYGLMVYDLISHQLIKN